MSAEDATPEEIREALTHLNETAKKAKAFVGSLTFDSPWDKAHNQINDLLDRLQEAEQQTRKETIDQH